MPVTDRRELGPVSSPLWVPESGTRGAWDEIARSVLSSAASSISFQSIPTEYRMFRLECYIKPASTNARPELTLNNDTGANYDHQELSYSSTTNNSARVTGDDSVWPNSNHVIGGTHVGLLTAVFGKPLAANEATGIIRTTYGLAAATVTVGVQGFVWNNTADLISRVDVLDATASNLDVGSTFVLYGNKT